VSPLEAYAPVFPESQVAEINFYPCIVLEFAATRMFIIIFPRVRGRRASHNGF